MSSDSDTDWFDKDEDELVNQIKKPNPIVVENNRTEYIPAPKENRPEIIATAEKVPHKFTTKILRALVTTNPLDVFLGIVTRTDLGSFLNEIQLNDSAEHILMYLRCLSMICDLQLPGYHEEMLRSFATNEILLQSCRNFADKLFVKHLDKFWLDSRVDQFICDLQKLLLAAYSCGICSASFANNGKMNILQYMYKLIVDGDGSEMAKRSVIVEFREQLEAALNNGDEKNEDGDSMSIYPTLAELLNKPEIVECGAEEHDTSTETPLKYSERVELHRYLQGHRTMLREQFIGPLRDVIARLKTNSSKPPTFVNSTPIYNDVCIVLNENYLNANRHEMVFIDFIGTRRRQNGPKVLEKELKSQLNNQKTGALWCLATNCKFENLILARVTYTDKGMLSEGFVGIEISRQYNIGNIYNRQFIAFESPEFFEPFHKVHSYLSSRNANSLPMQEYIVSGKVDVKAPAYLDTNKVYTIPGGQQIKPLECQRLEISSLNETQCRGLLSALTSELSIIQGPPGTGKTHFSVQLVKTLIANAPRTPIIVLTYTNDSLDKFLVKLSEHTEDIVRFGSQGHLPEIARFNVRTIEESITTNPLLKRLYYTTNLEFTDCFQRLLELHRKFDGTDEAYHEIIEAQKDLRSIQDKLDCIRILFQYYAALTCNGVIAMTTTCGAKMNFLFQLLKSSIVIFEEAAEILESHVISCLTPYTEHVIMIGDHMQLRPFTIAKNKSCISLFERLIGQGIPAITFNLQYRMRPCIADLLCPTIYKAIDNDKTVTKYPSLVLGMQKNMFFVTHNRPETISENQISCYNPYEVDEVFKLIQHLEYRNKGADMVVLSPYKLQVDMIQRKLNKKGRDWKSIRVATVDSFQGLEAKIIVLSLVRSKTIGFLSDKHRICVALSRAMEGLYMIGNMSMLAEQSHTWRIIRDKLLAQDAIGESFPLEGSGC